MRPIVAAIARLWNAWIANIRTRQTIAGKAATVGVGVFALCCVCSLGLGAVRATGQAVGLVATNTATPEPTSTARPTERPSATPTSAPTSTPEPSATPAPSATPSPAPTNTPVPTQEPPSPVPPTATPSLTAEEQQALTAMGKQIGEIGDALSKIGVLAQNFENTDAWKVDIYTQMLRVQQAHEALLKQDVPPKLGALRGAIINATTDCDAAMDKLANGIDHGSAADFQAAATLMASCTRKIGDAQSEMDALN